MKRINTILLTISTIGLIVTGGFMSDIQTLKELHRLLSIMFTICFIAHMMQHRKALLIKKRK